MATNYPYTSKTSTIPAMLERAQKMSVPAKVTQKFLTTVGFTSSADRKIVNILKFIRYLDDSGTPTERWKQHRDSSKAPAVLAGAIREAYSELFEIYPDAHNKDNEALTNFFKTQTGLGEQAVNYMVRTFKALVELADFSSTYYEQSPTGLITSVEAAPDVAALPLDVHTPGLSYSGQGAGGISVNINIQLTIPETEKPEVYDNFFEALKKHLLS